MSDFAYFFYFNIIVLALLLFDLKVLHRHNEKITLKNALANVLFWVALAFAFNAWIYYYRGIDDALTFLAGYLIEYSLSIDNLFVFYVIFSFFQVPERLLHKVLFWGILGAVLMRGLFIFLGVALLENFHWMIYIFGIFLIFTGLRLPFQSHDAFDPQKNAFFRFLQRIIPVTHGNYDTFFVRKEGKLYATTLFIVLLIVESTDVVFAIDSIPAILGITTDPFLIYSSNIFAILGLRSLFFAFVGMMNYFIYLKYGLSLVLVFIGIKMLISGFFTLPTSWSLLTIFGILSGTILFSLLFAPQKEKDTHSK